jgi:hypothetical protein
MERPEIDLVFVLPIVPQFVNHLCQKCQNRCACLDEETHTVMHPEEWVYKSDIVNERQIVHLKKMCRAPFGDHFAPGTQDGGAFDGHVPSKSLHEKREA